MNQHAAIRTNSVAAGAGSASGLLQRACACGNHSPMIGTCPECARKKVGIQARLKIGASNDPLETEAERIADRLSTGRLDAATRITPAQVQRSAESEDEGDVSAPGSVGEVLAGPSNPLEGGVRRDMEQHFARDFSGVRVHSGAAAERSAEEIGANAYTAGSHIIFGRGQFAPRSPSGRHLLAHELTHVVQQAGSGVASIQRDDKDKKEDAKTPTNPFKTGKKQCGRATRENIDFPDTRITDIAVDLAKPQLTITWLNPKSLALPAGPFKISAGAGKCCLDCNDVKTSNKPGSLCTPKGGPFAVYSKGCVLSDTAWAKNPTFFDDSRDGIAIHAGPLPAYHASHGCVRTEEDASEIIHDNTVFGKDFAPNKEKGKSDSRTQVKVSGTWKGEICYKSIKGKSKTRADECKPEEKSKPKQKAAPADVAMDMSADDAGATGDEFLAQDTLMDGPGPA